MSLRTAWSSRAPNFFRPGPLVSRTDQGTSVWDTSPPHLNFPPRCLSKSWKWKVLAFFFRERNRHAMQTLVALSPIQNASQRLKLGPGISLVSLTCSAVNWFEILVGSSIADSTPGRLTHLKWGWLRWATTTANGWLGLRGSPCISKGVDKPTFVMPQSDRRTVWRHSWKWLLSFMKLY